MVTMIQLWDTFKYFNIYTGDCRTDTLVVIEANQGVLLKGDNTVIFIKMQFKKFSIAWKLDKTLNRNSPETLLDQREPV